MSRANKANSTKLARSRRVSAARRRAAKRKNAAGRISLDGAGSLANVRRRLLWLAGEWKLPLADELSLKDVPRWGYTTDAFERFIAKHHIDLFWLYLGRPKDYVRMLGRRRLRLGEAERDPVMAVFNSMTPIERENIRKQFRQLIVGHVIDDKSPPGAA